MKFIVLALCIAAALAAPADVEILKSTSVIDPESWNFAFEQSDGTKHDQAGVLKNAGSDNEAISVTGSFSFVADDGQTYTVTYIADENVS